MITFYILLREYDENPGFFLILLILDALFFLLIGYDKIIICEDRMVSMNRSLFEMVFNPKGTTYLLDKVLDAKLPEYSPLRDIISAARLVGRSNWFYLRLIRKDKNWVSFYLEIKDGRSIPIYTSFLEGEIRKIVEIINTLIAERAPNQPYPAQQQ